MQRLNTLVILLLITGLGGLTALSGCQTTAPKYINAEDQFSEQDVADIIEVVMDELPRATGYKLSQKPVIRFLKKEEFARVIARKVGSKNHKFGEHKRFARSVAAVYRMNPPTVLVVPEQIRFRVDDQGSSRHHAYIYLLTVLTHELVHALQDEHVGLKSVQAAGRAMKRQWTTKAIIEGHAELQTALVLHGLGLLDEVDDYLLSSDEDEDMSPEKDPLQREYEKRLASVYDQGKQFFAFHYRQSGNDYSWQIIKSKPPRESMLMNPETYSQQPLIEGIRK